MRAGTDLKGVISAVVTPLTADYEIDARQLALHCEAMLDAGCSFVSTFGTTGEGASLSVRQKITALEALKASGFDMSRQIPAIMTASLDDAADLLPAYSELGCRAALVIPPFYYKSPSDEAIADFFATMVDKAGNPGIDILLYNFPHFSGVTFTPALVAAVIERLGKRIVGIKDSTGQLDGGYALIERFPDLSVFTGDDRILSRMAAAGGAGMIGGMANLFPETCVALYRGHGTPALESLAAQRIETVDGNGGLAVIKAVLAQRYANGSFARMVPPLAPLNSLIEARVVAALEPGAVAAAE